MSSNATPNIPATTNLRKKHEERFRHTGRIIVSIMNFIVLVLSVLLIVYISIDTFEDKQLLENHHYMTFQLWVCIFFISTFLYA